VVPNYGSEVVFVSHARVRSSHCSCVPDIWSTARFVLRVRDRRRRMGPSDVARAAGWAVWVSGGSLLSCLRDFGTSCHIVASFRRHLRSHAPREGLCLFTLASGALFCRGTAPHWRWHDGADFAERRLRAAYITRAALCAVLRPTSPVGVGRFEVPASCSPKLNFGCIG
jgi:hypothetical protein